MADNKLNKFVDDDIDIPKPQGLTKEENELETLLKRAQLKKLQAEFAEEDRIKQERADKSKMQEVQLETSRQNLKREQDNCNHRSGGQDLAGLQGNGSLADYSVNKHTYPDNVTVVMCCRCQKEWRPGDKDYQTAMQWPTKMSPSSSALWNIPPKQQAVQALTSQKS